MLTRDEWDNLTDDEKYAEYRRAHYGGFSLSDIEWMAEKARKSFEQLEKGLEFASSVIKLGAVFGMDATTASAEMNAILKNQSILRLDQFGINAHYVKLITGRHTGCGMAYSDAFTKAVMTEVHFVLRRIENNTTQ